MDWGIGKLSSSLDNIKKDRNNVVNLLDKLIEDQHNVITKLKAMPLHEQKRNLSQFSLAHKHHSELAQKIFEIQLMLESYSSIIYGTSQYMSADVDIADKTSKKEISLECEERIDITAEECSPIKVENRILENSKCEQQVQHSTIASNSCGSEAKLPGAKNKSTVEEYLKSGKVKSRRERYLQQQPKSCIPDLSFQPVPFPENECKENNASNNPNIEEAPVPKKRDQCSVTYANTPDDFYITITNDLTTSKLITDVIREHAGNIKRFRSKNEAQKRITQYCLGYSKTYQDWYRCEIECWNTENGLIKIQFIDYGDSLLVDHTCIAEIPEVLYEFPKQTIHCCLEYLFPPNSQAKWPESGLRSFRKIMGVGEPKIFFIEYINPLPNGKLGVDLVNANEHENCTVGDVLINEGIAVQVLPSDLEYDDNSSEKLKLSGPKNGFMAAQLKAVHGLVNGNSSNENYDPAWDADPSHMFKTPGLLIEGYDCTDDMRICKFTKKDGTCFKGANCTKEHIQKRPDGMTTDRVACFDAPDDTFQPAVGETLEVTLTGLASPTQFYCFLKNTLPQFKQLLNIMNSPNMESQLEKLLLDPALGELVLAKLNRKWHRARVLEVQSHEQESLVLCKVFYVDFGYEAEVNYKDLRKMKEIFLQEPFFAHRIFISNISCNEHVNFEQQITYFKEHLENKPARAVIKYSAVHIFAATFADSCGNDIGMEFVRNGFAILTENNFTYNDFILVD